MLAVVRHLARSRWAQRTSQTFALDGLLANKNRLQRFYGRTINKTIYCAYPELNSCLLRPDKRESLYHSQWMRRMCVVARHAFSIIISHTHIKWKHLICSNHDGVAFMSARIIQLYTKLRMADGKRKILCITLTLHTKHPEYKKYFFE